MKNFNSIYCPLHLLEFAKEFLLPAAFCVGVRKLPVPQFTRNSVKSKVIEYLGSIFYILQLIGNHTIIGWQNRR